MSDLQVYQDHAQRFEAAYQAHLKKYALLHPRPQKPKMTSAITWHHFIVALILIATAIVSASHTLPVMFKGYDDTMSLGIKFLLALATFIMVELAAIYFSYTFIQEKTTPDNIPSIKKPVAFGVVFTIGAMFAINIFSVLSVSKVIPEGIVWTVVEILIFLWVASIAPANAWISGDILGIQSVYAKRENALLMADYDESVMEWSASFERSWSAKKKDYGIGIRVSKPQTDGRQLPSSSDDRLSTQTDNRQTGAGYRRASSAVDNAKKWLENNPDKAGLPLRQLADLIPDAGKDSISKARNQIKDNKQA